MHEEKTREVWCCEAIRSCFRLTEFPLSMKGPHRKRGADLGYSPCQYPMDPSHQPFSDGASSVINYFLLLIFSFNVLLDPLDNEKAAHERVWKKNGLISSTKLTKWAESHFSRKAFRKWYSWCTRACRIELNTIHFTYCTGVFTSTRTCGGETSLWLISISPLNSWTGPLPPGTGCRCCFSRNILVFFHLILFLPCSFGLSAL